jgi:penicillin G amidase
MKRLKVALLISSAAFLACAPAITSNKLEGLSGPVTVTRDQWGVPHIKASTDLDAFWAQGYVHAQGRLWQMELNRRTGAGRLSEILGDAALEQDKFLRTWGFYRAAQASESVLSDHTRAVLKAYAAGVNAFIAEGKLPLEFTLVGSKPEPWVIADSLVWAKMLAFDLADNWSSEVTNTETVKKIGLEGLNEIEPGARPGTSTIVRLEEFKGALKTDSARASNAGLQANTLAALQHVAAIQKSLPTFAGPDRDTTGSNNWVVSGKLTTTGKPMLANDPHLRLSAPSLWYFADLEAPNLHAIGASLPNIPGIVLGRNDRIAWGATNSAPDTQDLFVLDVKDGAYSTPNGPVKLETREEIIKVKGGADVKWPVRSSAYGPVISDAPVAGIKPADGQAVALRYVSLEPGDTTLDAFLGFNYAKNWSDFLEAMRSYVAPMQNFVYADVDGNIGYFAPGKIPTRNWDGRLPASASKGENWTGFVPFDQLPILENPREGFIVTANNKMLPHQSAFEPSTYTDHWRAQRIRERILSAGKISLETMNDIQADTLSIIARELVPGLLELPAKSDAARRLQAVVRGWDLKASLRSTGVTAFAFYYRELLRVLEDEIGKKYHNVPLFITKAFTQGSKYCDDTRTKDVTETCAMFMSQALENGSAALEAKLGSDPNAWQWERIHRTNFKAILGAAPVVGGLFERSIANNGSTFTVNVAGYNQDTFIQTAGPSYRGLFDFSNLDSSRYMHTLGQSGDAFSKHFDDFLPLWRDVQTIPMSRLEKDWGATEVQTIKP